MILSGVGGTSIKGKEDKNKIHILLHFLSQTHLHPLTSNTSINNFLNYELETRFWVAWTTAIFRKTLALFSSKFLKCLFGANYVIFQA